MTLLGLFLRLRSKVELRLMAFQLSLTHQHQQKAPVHPAQPSTEYSGLWDSHMKIHDDTTTTTHYI